MYKRQVTAFERCEGVGGNWRFNDPSGHSSVFETTHIISSKYTSFYEDYPLPESASDYPSHLELLEYFNNYADHFDIKKLIHFGTEVTSCRQKQDGSWVLEWKNLKDGQVFSNFYDALVVCNGHHHKPRYPDYPGEFSGEMIHSHDFNPQSHLKIKEFWLLVEETQPVMLLLKLQEYQDPRLSVGEEVTI